MKMQCFCRISTWKEYTAKPCKFSKDHVQVAQITENFISHDGIVDKNTGKMKKKCN